MPADAIIDLRSVLNYYSPLIFGLKNTDGRTELLKKCGVVFENMKQFPDLPEQMVRRSQPTTQDIDLLHTDNLNHFTASYLVLFV